uniref:Resistin n=1 Tax=Leptobrachium leishanense TaxID=445787 RepID=A0A8C5QHU7_9ANUR
MKMFGVLLILSLGAVLIDGCVSECSLSDLSSLNSLMRSMAETVLANARVECSDSHQKGNIASCPEGTTPVSCSCGMGCGSWDIRSDTTCHCQCAGMDWTTARCCKVSAKK